ncbi:hypothetical protein PAECIP111891_05191 [Paenibacillus allorhizoplanae]|uniref:Uncharacterized protein n=1 Tax=Paenibacillus allorhizoplanae TaxID=2905648 RepID=A0ABM9CRT0_9BACL|nr:hypothetical protein PAECIP111891_05191 [Paenibacillus allorhizoplanae]
MILQNYNSKLNPHYCLLFEKRQPIHLDWLPLQVVIKLEVSLLEYYRRTSSFIATLKSNYTFNYRC